MAVEITDLGSEMIKDNTKIWLFEELRFCF